MKVILRLLLLVVSAHAHCGAKCKALLQSLSPPPPPPAPPLDDWNSTRVAQWVASLGAAFRGTAASFELAGVDGGALHELWLQHQRRQRDEAFVSTVEVNQLLPVQLGARLHFLHRLRQLFGDHLDASPNLSAASAGAPSPSPPNPRAASLMARIQEGLERARRAAAGRSSQQQQPQAPARTSGAAPPPPPPPPPFQLGYRVFQTVDTAAEAPVAADMTPIVAAMARSASG